MSILLLALVSTFVLTPVLLSTVSLITLVLALIYFQLLYHRGEFET